MDGVRCLLMGNCSLNLIRKVEQLLSEGPNMD